MAVPCRRIAVGRAAASVFLLIACSFSPWASSWAGELVVDPKGGGDAETIQGAVSLAAPGDTIRIRPGVYTDSALYSVPGAVWETHVAITKDRLTFIGDHRDSVIVGPPTAQYDFGNFDPVGFAAGNSVELTIKNVTVRNCYAGFNADGAIVLSNVAADSCFIGAAVRGSVSLIVEDSVFRGADTGVLVASSSVAPVVRNCVFENSILGATAANSTSAVFQSLVATNVRVGFQFEQLSTGRMEDCRIIAPESAAISIADAESVLVEQSFLGGDGSYTLNLCGATTELRNCVLELGARSTVILSSGAELKVSGSHIATAGPQSIWCSEGSYAGSTPIVIEMENNYWALPDSASIADVVWDIHDNPEIKAVVDFMPFSATPLTSPSRSVGGFKAQFRRR